MKIISFSLWGNNSKYCIGAIENSIQQKRFWPDWVCRFYIHRDVNRDIIKKLEDNGSQVIIVNDDISKEKEYGTVGGIHMGWFWRFNVLGDKNIERVIVRDIDSRPSQREQNCVRDWIKSGREFHIIRDHRMHGVPICAGMWGATHKFINRINYLKLREEFITPHDSRYGGYDQQFLAECIYPLVKNSALIHDDWDRYREGAKSIPHLKIEGDFIGKPIEI